MEKHKMSSHAHTERHKCESCEKEFISEIRLKSHTQSHNFTTKYCHYCNNGKECVYDELGCRFRHEKSEKCKYGERCKKLLCGYRHNLTETSNNRSPVNSLNYKV